MMTDVPEPSTRSRGQAALAGMKVIEPLIAIAMDENSAPAFMKGAMRLAQGINEEDLNALASLAKVSEEILESIILTRALISISGRALSEADIDAYFKEKS